MITIKKQDNAVKLSARASTTDLVSGMAVVMVQGAAAGDQPVVRRATALELADATVRKFIVSWDEPDSNDVDFTIDPATSGLTAIAKTIPQDAQVVCYTGNIEIAYHEAVLPSSVETLREGNAMGFDAATSLPSVAADAELVCGLKYRIDGPEHVFLIQL